MTTYPIGTLTPPTSPNNGLSTYKPEPRNSNSFGNVLGNLANSAANIAGGALGMGGIDPMYTALINEQIRTQQQMQLVSFVSNIEKSKHETQMAAVRNIRVG